MNKNTEFKISYDGDALREHLMNVRDLAPALLSVGLLFDEANRILNKGQSKVALQVKAHQAGSFEIFLHLSQGAFDQLGQLLTGETITSILNLKELVVGAGGLFWLTKKLKGKKPQSIIQLENNMVRLEFEGDTLDVPVPLLKLYQDRAVRQAAHEVLTPLQQEGIDTFKIVDNNQVVQSIEKKDLSYFDIPEAVEEKLVDSIGESAYAIVSLAFKEDNKWRLDDGSSTINAIIRDEDFLKKVNHNLVSFAKGDILRCRVRTTQWRTPSGLKTEHEVLEVLQHIPGAKQLSIFDFLDDTDTGEQSV